MCNLIIQFLDKLAGPELIAVIAAFLVSVVGVLRALGEVFIALGNFGGQADKENWLDSAGAFFRKLSMGLGKCLAWFGIGNKK